MRKPSTELEIPAGEVHLHKRCLEVLQSVLETFRTASGKQQECLHDVQVLVNTIKRGMR